VTFAPAPTIFVELPFNDPAHFAQAAWHFGSLGIFYRLCATTIDAVQRVNQAAFLMGQRLSMYATAQSVAPHVCLNGKVESSYG
jgi:hypothetical protein